MDLLKQYGVSQRFLAEFAACSEEQPARVIAQYRGRYKIVTAEEERSAEISGRLRYDTEELAQYPTVGDYVTVTTEGGSTRIRRVLTRKSLFVRKAVGTEGQVQPVAANVDIVFLCMSLNRNFSLNRMERYLSVAWDSGATPVIVLTKSDLCEDLGSAVSQVEAISCFSDVIALSMYDEDLCEKFRPYFEKGQTCAFIGSSGVGKSTLINGLLGASVLETREIGRGDKGRHTTTGREMFPCPLGAWSSIPRVCGRWAPKAPTFPVPLRTLKSWRCNAAFVTAPTPANPAAPFSRRRIPANWICAVSKAIASWIRKPPTTA